jgi:hypothetical protein
MRDDAIESIVGMSCLVRLQSIVEYLTGLEERNVLLADRDLVSGARVAAYASRFLTVNASKRRNSTRSPRDKAAVITSKIVATMSSVSCRVRCGLASAIRRTSAALFISAAVRFLVGFCYHS